MIISRCSERTAIAKGAALVQDEIEISERATDGYMAQNPSALMPPIELPTTA